MSFQFKQFKIEDDHCAMKVGTDGVLLGAWADVSNAKNMLDIGTGSGLIALMLAQRTKEDVHIDAIELEKECADQARENVWRSPWKEKITVHHKDIQSFQSKKKYDLIVSNPPFFINSMLPPSGKRETARHTSTLSHEDLLAASKQLIAPNGKLAVIYPFQEGNDFIAKAQFSGFYLRRQMAFYSKETKPQERWLLELEQEPGPLKREKLILYEGAEWSGPYKKLVSAFYLHLV